MTVEPFNEQVELIKHILNRDTRVIVYGGGIRGGKTFGAFLGVFLYLKKYAGARAAVVRDSMPTLKRNTLPVYNKLVPLNRVQSYNQQLQTVRFSYQSKSKVNSELMFFPENYDHDKELNRWKGLEVNLFLLEEFNELQEASFNKAIERCGAWIVPDIAEADQPPPKIICTCNPSNGFVKELVYDKWVKGELPKGWVYIPALITNNPHIPQSYRDNLKHLPEKQYRTFVLGDWNSLELEDLFATEFKEELHVTEIENEIEPYYPVHTSFDFNIANTCLIIQEVGDEIRVIDEYHYKANLPDFAKNIKDDLQDVEIIINGDASGNNGSSTNNEGLYAVIQYVFGFRGWSAFRVPRANPTHKASRMLTNLIFKHKKIIINKRCAGLIKDLKNVQVIQKGSKVEIDKSNEELTHHLDPLRYYFHAEQAHLIKELGLEEFESK